MKVTSNLDAAVGIYYEHRIICKRMDTVVSFTQEYFRISYPQGMCVYNLRIGFFQGQQLNGRLGIERIPMG
jgi:hypothetical protein